MLTRHSPLHGSGRAEAGLFRVKVEFQFAVDPTTGCHVNRAFDRAKSKRVRGLTLARQRARPPRFRRSSWTHGATPQHPAGCRSRHARSTRSSSHVDVPTVPSDRFLRSYAIAGRSDICSTAESSGPQPLPFESARRRRCIGNALDRPCPETDRLAGRLLHRSPRRSACRSPVDDPASQMPSTSSPDGRRSRLLGRDDLGDHRCSSPIASIELHEAIPKSVITSASDASHCRHARCHRRCAGGSLESSMHERRFACASSVDRLVRTR